VHVEWASAGTATPVRLLRLFTVNLDAELKCKSEGMAEEPAMKTTLPHSSFGAPKCCGCLDGIVRGDQADIVCNECNAVVRRVSSAELRLSLTEMERSLEVSTAICPNCRAVKVARGFSMLLAFTCEECGAITKLVDHPMADRFFG
jgi:hypothetical protein